MMLPSLTATIARPVLWLWLLLVLLVAGLLTLGGSPPVSYAARTLAIAEARALPPGSTVTVQGAVQVFIYASTGIDVSRFQPGQTVTMTAFSAQFEDHYEINPRSASDIQMQ